MAAVRTYAECYRAYYETEHGSIQRATLVASWKLCERIAFQLLRDTMENPVDRDPNSPRFDDIPESRRETIWAYWCHIIDQEMQAEFESMRQRAL